MYILFTPLVYQYKAKGENTFHKSKKKTSVQKAKPEQSGRVF